MTLDLSRATMRIHISSFMALFLHPPVPNRVSLGRTTGILAGFGGSAPSGKCSCCAPARLMQQLKERAAQIVAHLSVQDISCEGGVALIQAEMENLRS